MAGDVDGKDRPRGDYINTGCPSYASMKSLDKKNMKGGGLVKTIARNENRG